ncbi:MAG: hypothetical protein LC118_18775 [Dehalococcoidia bacterium]|nr:hypothetical protein [Dehalococcoidia bacterium]
MLRHLFEHKASQHDTVFAEAQALIDDGLDLDFVLGLFPEDADWLRDELAFTGELTDAIAFAPPSYYFEGTLKSRFIAAGRAAAQPVAPATVSPLRTAFASLGVLAATGIVGAITLGFVTAGEAVPGDWNYTFKIANERLQYALSNGNERVDIQLRQAEARVYEIKTRTSRGDVSASDLASLQREAQAIADLARQQPLDDFQQARVKAIADTSKTVFSDVRAVKPALDPSVKAASAAVDDAVTTALSPIATPTATATASPAASPTASSTATKTASPSPDASPAKSATPQPTATATSTPEPTATASPNPSETPAATPTASPASSATPSATSHP